MPKFFYRIFSFIVNLLWGIKSARLGSKLNGDFYIFRDNTPFSYLFCAIFSKRCVVEFHDIPPFLSRLIFKIGLMISEKLFVLQLPINYPKIYLINSEK